MLDLLSIWQRQSSCVFILYIQINHIYIYKHVFNSRYIDMHVGQECLGWTNTGIHVECTYRANPSKLRWAHLIPSFSVSRVLTAPFEQTEVSQWQTEQHESRHHCCSKSLDLSHLSLENVFNNITKTSLSTMFPHPTQLTCNKKWFSFSFFLRVKKF